MRRITLIVLAVCVLALNASSVLLPSDLSGPVVSIICGLFNAFKVIAGAIASLVLVWAAVKYIGSADDPGARKYSRDIIKYVVIGLILIMLSEVLVLYVAPPGANSCAVYCSFLPC